jgi:glyoxylase-like metal-dependent hydrolase (beta-lactamase superfamily II)
LVGTAATLLVKFYVAGTATGLNRRHRVCQQMLRVGAATRESRRWETGDVLVTGFPAGWLQCNCYVLAPSQGSDAIIVDPGQRAMPRLRKILDDNRLTPAAVLLTHGHIDHIWSAQKVADTYGCPAFIHPEDRAMLTDPIKGFGPRLAQFAVGAMFGEPRQVVELDRDGDKIELAGMTVTVDHTPGHTRGSVCFRVSHPPGDISFTGDTLFKQSVGRTDLDGGSGRDLYASIVEKLLVLDDATVVLPGHGPKTTIGAERRLNPFLEGLSQ